MILNEKLLIIGASGHGKVVADIAIKMNKWRSIFFLDDDESIKTSMGLEVVGKTTDTFTYKDSADFFIAIGNNARREKIQMEIESEGASIPVLVHPNAVIGSDVELGVGTVIMAGVVINSCTKIGKGCIVNTGSTIDHDNEIEDFVHISPGVNLAGNVKVGHGTWVGIGCKVSNNVSITSGIKIGVGGVVLKDINELGTYVGVPARRVKKNEEDSYISK